MTGVTADEAWEAFRKADAGPKAVYGAMAPSTFLRFRKNTEAALWLTHPEGLGKPWRWCGYELRQDPKMRENVIEVRRFP